MNSRSTHALALILALLMAVPAGLWAAEDEEDNDASATRLETLAGKDLATAFGHARATLTRYLGRSIKKKAKTPKRRRKAHPEAREGEGAKEAQASLKEALAAAQAAEPPAQGLAFKAAFLAYADRAAEGLMLAASKDAEQADKGRRFVELAVDDLEALAASVGEPAASASSKKGEPGSHGNIGLDLTLGGYTDYSTFQLGVSYGHPVMKLLEVGGGVRLGLDFTGEGDASGMSFDYGLDLYSRGNFYGAFGTPTLVPFAGLHLGYSGSSGVSGKYWDQYQSNTSLALGPQAGLLCYLSRAVALSVTGQIDYTRQTSQSSSSSSSSGGGSSSSTSGVQVLLSAGLRFML